MNSLLSLQAFAQSVGTCWFATVLSQVYCRCLGMVQILSSSAYIMQSMINDHEQMASQYHGFAPQLHKRYNDIFGVACCSRVGLENYIHIVFNFHPALQFTNKISTLLFNLQTKSSSSTSCYALLMITSALLFTTRKPIPTPTFIISPHIPVIAKQSSSQLLRLLCYADSDLLEKGTEMVSFFEQRGYSPALLQNDLHNIGRIDRTDVLNNHRPFNRRSNRILFFLLTIKRILLRIFNILTGDPKTGEFFPKPTLVVPIAATATSVISSCVLRTATNSILTRVHLHAYTLAAALAITFPVIPTSFVIMNAFSCQIFGLVHCIRGTQREYC